MLQKLAILNAFLELFSGCEVVFDSLLCTQVTVSAAVQAEERTALFPSAAYRTMPFLQLEADVLCDYKKSRTYRS